MKPLYALPFLFFASLAVAAPATTSRFAFHVPDGWSDKSPGDRSFYTLAVDDADHLVFQAKVQPGGAPADAALLDKYAHDAEQSVKTHLPDVTFTVVEKKLVRLAGTQAARFVFETRPPGAKSAPIRQLQFYVPAGDQHAVLTFSAPREVFAKFVPLFERTARATVIKK